MLQDSYWVQWHSCLSSCYVLCLFWNTSKTCSIIHSLLQHHFSRWAVTANKLGLGRPLHPVCNPHINVFVKSLPEHRAGLAGQGPESPHSGLNRRTCAWEAEFHFPPLLVLWMSCRGPASSLPNQYTRSVTTYTEMNRHSLYRDLTRGRYW